MHAADTPAGDSPADRRRREIWQRCIARSAGACALIEGCLACGPIEQSLRTAGWALARWPHLEAREKP
jgi:hypothetical protein